MQERARHRAYYASMGTCVVLVLLAWNVVRLWSVPAAIAMSVVAAVIPPAAAIVGNLGFLGEQSRGRPDGPERGSERFRPGRR